jgi:hypothetical protein
MRGTAIVGRSEIHLTNITTLPSERAIAVEYIGIRLINVYAPSGTAKRKEKEHFYNTELPYLLRAAPETMILGGDFNFILDPVDATGHFQNSRPLAELVHALALKGTWQQNPAKPTFTHHSPSGATRIDRLYTSQDLMAKKEKNLNSSHRGSSRSCAMRGSGHTRHEEGQRPMEDEPHANTGKRIKGKIRHKWAIWKTHKRYYPEATLWWELYIKKQLRYFVHQEEAECRNDHRQMENHLYECIYDILQSSTLQEDKLPALKRYKAKLLRLHTLRINNVMLDNCAQDKLDGEEPTLFHIKMNKRHAAQTIKQVQDPLGNTLESPKDRPKTSFTPS